MAELAADRTAHEQIKEVALTDDGFDIAPEKVKDQDVAEEMPWIAVKKRRGYELPGVSVVHAAVAQREIIADKAGLKCVQKNLGNESSDINCD